MNKFLTKPLRFVHDEPNPLKFIKNENSDVIEPNQQLLDLIFGVDEVTGLPVGDLSYYLGENTNPEVKRFIELNLLSENADSGSLSLPTDVMNKMRETITDDDIARFSRCKDESKEDYACRINDFFNQERLRRAEEQRHKEFRKRVDNVIKSYASGN